MLHHDSSARIADPVRELIRSEETYVSELTVLVETFVAPLESWLSKIKLTRAKQYPPDYCLETILLDENIDVIAGLFSNIRVIWDCNKLLLDSLHESDSKKQSGAVIAAFHRHAPYLKLYSQYTRNYNSAGLLLTRLMNDSRFAAFIACAELQKQCHGLGLAAFLIMPVQRGPRYELLLKEMIKKCNDHDERNLLQSALLTIVGVIRDIDSAVGSDERVDKLLELQNAFRISLSDPARAYVRSGNLRKLCHTGKKTFFFVLCSDLIFYGEEVSASLLSINGKSPAPKRYKFHREFFLDEILLVLNPNESKSFVVRGIDKAFEVEAASPEECSLWVNDIIRMKSIKRLNVHSNAPIITKKHPMGQLFRVWQEAAGGGMVLRTYSIPQQVVVGGVMLMCDLQAEDDDLDVNDRRRYAGASATYDSHRLSYSSRRTTATDAKEPASKPSVGDPSLIGVASTASLPTTDQLDSSCQAVRRHSTPASVVVAASSFAGYPVSQHRPLVALHSDLVDVFGSDMLTPQIGIAGTHSYRTGTWNGDDSALANGTSG